MIRIGFLAFLEFFPLLLNLFKEATYIHTQLFADKFQVLR